MKVLAQTTTHESLPCEYNYCLPDEIVVMAPLSDEAFMGVRSTKGTTCCIVKDVDFEDVYDEMEQGLEETVSLYCIIEMLALAQDHEIGDILIRHGDFVRRKVDD